MDSSIWDQVLARIETKVNRHSFYTWFRPTSLIADNGIGLTVRVPNPLFTDWLTKHYSVVLSEATFGPGPVPDGMLHLDAPTVGRLAADTRVGHLIVAHVRMGFDLDATLQAARDAFGGPTSMARPGDRFDV